MQVQARPLTTRLQRRRAASSAADIRGEVCTCLQLWKLLTHGLRGKTRPLACHVQEGYAKRAASVAQIPIINAGDGPGQHPTQVPA